MATVLKHDEALEEQSTSDATLDEVHERALKRFDAAVIPQLEQRAQSLAARRFAVIAGAQWEGDWADPYENAVKFEINKVGRGLEKIIRDYNENRIVPDFRPAGGRGNEESAATLDGLHRADGYNFKAQQARDNAFAEAAAGGFGAYRLTNEWEDPYDKDNDKQRINPGLVIGDADQRVFFDPQAELYDKADARYGFVLTAKDPKDFEEQYDEAITEWPDALGTPNYDWFTEDLITVAEYYEVEDTDDDLLIFTHTLSGEEQRWWKSEIERSEITELRRQGWTMRTRSGRRRRVHKYVLSGAEVLEDQGYIAGDCIPIVPVYGKRWFVNGVERFSGHVQEKMDAQRLYNSSISRMQETNQSSPRETPMFAPSQMPPELAKAWANQLLDRPAYLLVEPLIDPQTGQIIANGPIGTLNPPQVPPLTATLMQISNNDLLEDQLDGADEVKANTSADALEVAATRVDARSGIYLDNMRQSVQREGEIYLSMCADIYWEPEREVETMTEDGDDGIAVLQEPYTDPKSGTHSVRNDFRRGAYKVVADVTEATATRRDKTVKSALRTAEVAMQVGNPDLANAALITAIANQDGEGMSDLQRYARRLGVKLEVLEPTEDEKKAMDEAQQGAAPDPAQAVMEGQAQALAAAAEKDQAQAIETAAKTKLHEAKTIETLAKARELGAETVDEFAGAAEQMQDVAQGPLPQSMLAGLLQRLRGGAPDGLEAGPLEPPGGTISR